MVATEWYGEGPCEPLGARVEALTEEEALFLFDWPGGNPEGLMELWAVRGEDTPQVQKRSLLLLASMETALRVSRADAREQEGWVYHLVTVSGREVGIWDVGPLGMIHQRAPCNV